MSRSQDDSPDIEAGMHDTFARLAAGLQPAELSADSRGRMLGRIRARIAAPPGPPPPVGTQTWRSGEAGWRETGLVHSRLLRVDAAAGMQELLVRFLPGARVPAHSHLREEEMVILQGECLVGEHPLRAGDVHVAPPGSWHPEITSERGTLLVLRCEYPFPTEAASVR